MKEIVCPFCKQIVTEDAEPEKSQTALGTVYICYRKICRNKLKHWNKANIIIPYKKGE